MRERKYVKFRVDMYQDTKFKIIDMKPERDLIHYVWTRLITLAGKVNCEGDLYMSKNIPYTVETLAIEFNRGIDQVKLALEVLMELEMIELTEDRIYRVKNFAKHQNIKVKEKISTKDKEDIIKNEEVKIDESQVNSNKEAENKISHKESENIRNEEVTNLEINYKDANKIDDTMINDKVNDILTGDPPILLKVNKNKRRNKEKNQDITFEITDEEIGGSEMDGIHDEERPLGKGECIMTQWAFS